MCNIDDNGNILMLTKREQWAIPAIAYNTFFEIILCILSEVQSETEKLYFALQVQVNMFYKQLLPLDTTDSDFHTALFPFLLPTLMNFNMSLLSSGCISFLAVCKPVVASVKFRKSESNRHILTLVSVVHLLTLHRRIHVPSHSHKPSL